MDHGTLEEFIERARPLRRRNELDATAAGVFDAFGAAGVRSLLLKGPALAQLLYLDGEHRGYSDIDLLVAPSDLAEARRLLGSLGYVKAGQEFGIDDVAGVQHAETWAQAGESGPLWIDLHWRLGGCEAPDDVAWVSLAARSSSIELEGRRVPVLNREGLALHLALHAAQHGPRDTKAMADLARGLERWGDDVWRAAAGLAAEVDATVAFAAGLRLLEAGDRLARELGLPEADQMQWEILHRRERPRGTFHLRALAETRGLRERADVLRRSLLPTPEWITWEIPWAAKGRLHLFAAYGWHVIRAPAWAARAWRFRRRAGRVGDDA